MKIFEVTENISHTSKRLRDIEQERGVKVGSNDWFKLWFSLPYLKESNPFTDARMNAIKAGKTEFTVKGKTYKVTGDTSDEREAVANQKLAEETGKEMLKIFRGMHHDAGMNKDMDRYIRSHDWKLGDFTPDMFPSEEEFFDYDDPFDRIIDIDYSHRVNLAAPIIVGPQYSDGKYSIIDGNHRAAAAQKMGKTIQAYFPVAKTIEARTVTKESSSNLSRWKNKEPAGYVKHLQTFFGPPEELTNQRAIWYNKDGFKRIEVLDEFILHASPLPHYDYAYSYVDMKVPHNLSDELAASSESILIDHLKGEVGARCASLSANAVTLQYVMDVVEGNIEPSKREYETRIKSMKKMFADGQRYELDWWPDVTGDTDPNNPYYKDDVDENFADGKNPERKGLAKRVGVDTKDSVSDLRKTAKNSSGEKQRMAHWLANMKAGKAKNK